MPKIMPIENLHSQPSEMVDINRLISQQLNPGGNIPKLQNELNYNNSSGQHTKKSPVVGSRAAELIQVRNAMELHGELKNFIELLEKHEEIRLIPERFRIMAEAFSKEKFVAYLEKYTSVNPKLTAENAVEFVQNDSLGCLQTKIGWVDLCDSENQWNTWRLSACVRSPAPVNEKNCHIPLWAVACREFMHIEECQPGALKENFYDLEDYLKNCLTTLKILMLQDEVYKRVSGHALNEVVNYEDQLRSPTDNTVDVGEIAHFYRQLESQHANLAEALVSDDSLKFLKTCGFE